LRFVREYGASGVVAFWGTLHPPAQSRKGKSGGDPEIALVTTEFVFKQLQTGFPQQILAM
jgi:hypothetical protein